MDGQANEELVVDQFLLGMDNHELSVQVAAHGHWHTEDVLRLARSLEAVHEEERHASHPRKSATQARFVNNGPPDTSDAERVVQQVLAQLGHESRKHRGGRRRKPTPGPKRVRSADRREVKPASRTPSRDSRRGRSPSMEGRSRSREEPLQCYKCKGFGHFTRDCPSDGYYRVGPNGRLETCLESAPRILYEGARIGEVYPVTSLKQYREMLPVDSQLSD